MTLEFAHKLCSRDQIPQASERRQRSVSFADSEKVRIYLMKRAHNCRNEALKSCSLGAVWTYRVDFLVPRCRCLL